MVGADGPVGQCQLAALAPTDHGLDDVTEKPACRSAVSQFTAPLKVFPGDLERILEKLGERNGHERKTNENRARSMSSPLRCSLSYFDRNRLGPKDDIAEHVGLRRVQGIADREARIPPIASACDLPSLLLSVPCDSLALAFCTDKRNTWTSHSPCESESLLCAKRPEPPGGRMDSSRQERSRC